MEITLNLVAEIDPVAIYAALVATTILIWDVVKWLRSGPRLRTRASSGMIIVGDPDPRRHGKTFVSVIATNAGSSPTTITTLSMAHYKNPWDRFRRKPQSQFVVTMPETSPDQGLPRMLHVGEQWTGLIEQTSEVVEMAKNGLLYADIHHSVWDKPARARITIRNS